MSHILAVTGNEFSCSEVFHRLKSTLVQLTNQTPVSLTSHSWLSVAVSSKEVGEATRFSTDPLTGASIAIVGSWLLGGGTHNDSMNRLLARCVCEPLEKVAIDIEGTFILLFSDPRTRSVSIVTDIVGSLHLFMTDLEGVLAFCTSSRALAALKNAPFDAVAVQEFWATGNIYENRSLWQGVRKIGPSTILTICGDGSSKESKYWSFQEINGRSLGLADASAQVSEELSAAAGRIASSYPNLLLDVTGGYDSRITMSGFMRRNIPFSGTVSGPDDSADVFVSRKICNKFNIPHFHVNGDKSYSESSLMDALALTDGEMDIFEYSRIAAIHRTHASRGFSASINGSFGELARGYWWELLFPSIGSMRTLDAEMLSKKRFASASYDKEIFSDSIRINMVEHMRDVIARSANGLRDKPNTTQMDHTYLDLRMQRWQGRIASSTSHIWPSFSPFMFLRVMTPVLNATPMARWRSLLARHMLKHTNPTLANLPLEHGHPATTASLNNLHKFLPIVTHYGDRIKERLIPHNKAETKANGQSELLAQLGLLEISNWRLAENSIFSRLWIQNQIQKMSTQGITLAGKRLITLELTLRSVEGSKLNCPH